VSFWIYERIAFYERKSILYEQSGLAYERVLDYMSDSSPVMSDFPDL